MAKARYCERCGNVYYPLFWSKKCNFCKAKLKEFPEEMMQKYKIFDESWMELLAKLNSYINLSVYGTVEGELSVREELVTRENNFALNELAGNPLFSMEEFERRVQKRRKLDRELTEATDRRRRERFAQTSGGTAHMPRCPICGSSDIHKIAIGTRAVKTAAFGIAGAVDDAGKTYKCSNCGSKF